MPFILGEFVFSAFTLLENKDKADLVLLVISQSKPYPRAEKAVSSSRENAQQLDRVISREREREGVRALDDVKAMRETRRWRTFDSRAVPLF